MDIVRKFKERKAVIGIAGMGYVGLPLMLEYAKEGYRVIGFDTDEQKVQALNQGKSYLGHISSELISEAKEKGFDATSDFRRVVEIDALIIAVPTPLTKHREPDLSFVISTIESALPYLKKEQIISLESTTYPGTTDEIIRPMIEKQGFNIGKDFYLVYSPEREDPGRKDFNCRTTPKLCGGVTKTCLKVGVALYEGIVEKVIQVSSAKTAELAKVLENTQRAVNIGLANEMKIVADKMGIDIFEAIEAASTKPFGYMPYYPGPGIGGHCIPIDPFYLTWKAREYGIHTRFIELAGEINDSMPDYVVGKIVDSLNKNKKSLSGSKILVMGIAYKKDVDDTRESPAVAIMEKLRERGALVEYSDPNVPKFPRMRKYSFNLSSKKIDAAMIKSFDCVVIATDHSSFDYNLIKEHAQLIVDTRGVYKENFNKLVKA